MAKKGAQCSGGFASNDNSGGGSDGMCSLSVLPSLRNGAAMAVDRLCATVTLHLFLLSIHLPGRLGAKCYTYACYL